MEQITNKLIRDAEGVIKLFNNERIEVTDLVDVSDNLILACYKEKKEQSTINPNISLVWYF